MKEVQELEKMISILAAKNESSYAPVIELLEQKIIELLNDNENEQ